MTGKISKSAAKRQRREAAERKKRTRRMMIGGGVGLVVVVLVVLAVTASGPEELADVELFTDMGGGHLGEGEALPTYNSNPPTSGRHSASSTPCGIYLSEVADPVQVHNLEHGTVVIQYRPDLSESDVELIQDLARSKPSHILVAPRSDLSDAVVITSWRRLLRLETVDVDVINVYYGEFVRTGPEVGVACPFAIDESA